MNFLGVNFREKSEKILKTFYKAKDELQSMNALISNDNEAKQQSINELKGHIDSNNEIYRQNSNVIKNIEKILS